MLPCRRERKRLKTIPSAESGDVVGSVMQEYVDAKRVKQPESGPVGGNQGGGFGKTSTYTPLLHPFLHTHKTQRIMLTIMRRLGPRNPQTLHLLPLLRNPRIPHPNNPHPTPPPHMLRIRPPPRPRPRLRRPPQHRDRNIHQRSARQPTRQNLRKRQWLRAHRRV